MDENPRAVMTVDEVSRYLRIPKSTLYKLAQERRVPCQKVGRHWRFRKEALDRWLEEGDTRAQSGSREG
jgi:excisionase family DNA binding protein